jgi:dienelactone hydrolase
MQNDGSRGSNTPLHLLILVLLLFMSSQALQAQGGAARLFAYDKTAPMDVREDMVNTRDGVTIHVITYAPGNARHARVDAFVVTPDGKGPFAGVLFFHWLGKPNGDRSEFLEDAVELAKKGTVSLLIQGAFPWLEEPTSPLADRQQIIEQTVEVRRALDLLLSLDNVDPKRIGFVGHDYGAMFGAVAAGVEKRVKAWVLVAGMGTFSEWALKYWPATGKDGEDAYRSAMKPFDPAGHIGKAAPAALFFQFSDSDTYISKAEALAFYTAARNPKEIRWYACGHAMDAEAVRTDRISWLQRRLHLSTGAK